MSFVPGDLSALLRAHIWMSSTKGCRCGLKCTRDMGHPQHLASVIEAHLQTSPEQIALAWHDVTCPEGPECRDRALHAHGAPLVHTGVLERFVELLRARRGLLGHP